MNDILHSPPLFLIVAAFIGYFWPLASARIGREHWAPEVEGLITFAGTILTGLGADLAHAALTTHSDFSWRVWGAAAFSSLLSSLIGQAQTWRGSRIAARLRAKGSRNMHTDTKV